jgi:hypothetical protein
LSDEVDNFKREIQINSDATFLDLHNEILDATDYDRDQLYSFFICGDNWSKQTEVTQIEMDVSSEDDSYVMDSTPLDELIEDEHQKLLYVFDSLSERVLFIELREIITGRSLDEPLCTKSAGNPPKQFIDYDSTLGNISSDIDDEFYGDEDYDDEELEGFTSLDELDERY